MPPLPEALPTAATSAAGSLLNALVISEPILLFLLGLLASTFVVVWGYLLVSFLRSRGSSSIDIEAQGTRPTISAWTVFVAGLRSGIRDMGTNVAKLRSLVFIATDSSFRFQTSHLDGLLVGLANVIRAGQRESQEQADNDVEAQRGSRTSRLPRTLFLPTLARNIPPARNSGPRPLVLPLILGASCPRVKASLYSRFQENLVDAKRGPPKSLRSAPQLWLPAGLRPENSVKIDVDVPPSRNLQVIMVVRESSIATPSTSDIAEENLPSVSIACVSHSGESSCTSPTLVSHSDCGYADATLSPSIQGLSVYIVERTVAKRARLAAARSESASTLVRASNAAMQLSGGSSGHSRPLSRAVDQVRWESQPHRPMAGIPKKWGTNAYWTKEVAFNHLALSQHFLGKGKQTGHAAAPFQMTNTSFQ